MRDSRVKTAMLLAVVGLSAPEPVSVVDYHSDDSVLTIGPAECATPWAERLAGQLSVTVLVTGRGRTSGPFVPPIECRWPIHAGGLARVNGWLGALEVQRRSRNPIDLDRCMRCSTCIDVCPEGAIDALYQIGLGACRDHRACIKVCGGVSVIDFSCVGALRALSGQFDPISDLNGTLTFAQH